MVEVTHSATLPPVENDEPSPGQVVTNPWFKPEQPDWVRGVVTLLFVCILVAMIFANRDNGPAFAAVSGLTGMALGYFFKR
jgi:hypothetical protein